MLTTREESNHLPGFTNRRVAVGKCARADTGVQQGGGRWGANDFLGYACMRPGPPVKCVFPERRVRRDWGARLGVQLRPCMVLIIQG